MWISCWPLGDFPKIPYIQSLRQIGQLWALFLAGPWAGGWGEALPLGGVCVCSRPGSVYSPELVSAPVPHLWSLGPQMPSASWAPQALLFWSLVSTLNCRDHWAWSHRNQWVPGPAPASRGQAEETTGLRGRLAPRCSGSHSLSRVTCDTSLPMILHHQ